MSGESGSLTRQSYRERPAHGGYPTPSGLVAVKMSPKAADALAEACGWASYWAAELWDGNDVPATAPRRERAIPTYEWLSWGREWLRRREARVDVG